MSTLAYMAIAVAALVPRLLFALLAPAHGGDDLVYFRVAENIYQHLCVSMSDPASGACVPHWGGNHYPGFPAFIALSFVLFGHHALAPLLGAIAVTVGAILRLTYAVRRFTGSAGVALAAGLCAALSPLQVAWARFVLTEALFVALAVWLLAELLLSLSERRLRIVPVALAIAAAAFVRHDGLLFAVPVAVAGFAVHAPAVAIRRGAVIGILIALPLAAWAWRCTNAGLSLLPPALLTTDGAPAPLGYMQWRRTWEVTSYEAAGAQYGVNTRTYRDISLPAAALDRPGRPGADRAVVEPLLAELGTHMGEPFPPHIDAAFRALARERRQEDPMTYWAWLPLRRAWHMWFDPLASMGWPAEARGAGIALSVSGGGLGGLLQAALANPGVALTKGLVSGYRMALIALFVAIGVAVSRRWPNPIAVVVAMAGAFAVARTVFFVAMLATQSRYLVAIVPLF